jgi:hypothetical protein
MALFSPPVQQILANEIFFFMLFRERVTSGQWKNTQVSSSEEGIFVWGESQIVSKFEKIDSNNKAQMK